MLQHRSELILYRVSYVSCGTRIRLNRDQQRAYDTLVLCYYWHQESVESSPVLLSNSLDGWDGIVALHYVRRIN